MRKWWQMVLGAALIAAALYGNAWSAEDKRPELGPNCSRHFQYYRGWYFPSSYFAVFAVAKDDATNSVVCGYHASKTLALALCDAARRLPRSGSNPHTPLGLPFDAPNDAAAYDGARTAENNVKCQTYAESGKVVWQDP